MKKIFTFLSILLCLSAKAQDTLNVGQYDYTVYEDTVASGTLDSVEFWLINPMSSSFSDTAYLITSVMDSSGSFFFNHVDTMMFTGFIPSNDSVKITTYPDYTVTSAPGYHYDINVIVIWPYGLSSSGDSLWFNVFITVPNSIAELSPERLLQVFPNPSSTSVQFKNADLFDLEEVRIFDQAGRLAGKMQPDRCIPVDHLPKGTYILEVRLRDGRVKRVKMIRQ